MLLFMMISRVLMNNSVGKSVAISSLYNVKSFRRVRMPILVSIFVYIDTASAMNSLAPLGICNVESSSSRALESCM